MKNATSKSSLVRLLAAGALVSGMFAASGAMACTVDNWSSASGVTAGDPAADGISRYQGLCGLEVTGSGYVQDNSPAGIDRIVARFYVLNDNTAPATIYSGFSANDATGEVFNVTLDDAGQVTLTDTATGQTVSQSGSTDWLSVEIDWVRDASGSISLSVNGQAAAEATGFDNTGASQLASVQLGNLDGAAGTLGFDSYESRRSTAVGRVCVGDADPSGERDFADLTAIFGELVGGSLASGTPDATEDGIIDFDDVTAIFGVIVGGQGECP